MGGDKGIMNKLTNTERAAAAGSQIAQLELAKEGADPELQAILANLQDRRRVQMIARMALGRRRSDP